MHELAAGEKKTVQHLSDRNNPGQIGFWTKSVGMGYATPEPAYT